MAQTSISYKNHIYKLSYEIINPQAKIKILILHGWGANKELMKQALSPYLKDFTQIYIDLPGFGNSSIEDVLDSKAYAELIDKFLKDKNLHINIFLGHSFGGKLSALLCGEDQILILLSSAGIVLKKPLKVRLKIRLFKTLKKFNLNKLYPYFVSKDGQNLNALMYETFKKVVDEDFSNIFQKQKAKTLIFWGINDSATPLQSGEKIHSLMQNSKFYSLEGDHFFFLQKGDFIAEKLLKEFYA